MKINAFSWLALSYFGYYIAYGVFVPFFPSWLQAHQYSAETIGMIIAASYVFRFAGGLYFSGRIRQVSELPFALRLLAWSSVLITLFIAFAVESLPFLLIGVMLFSLCNAAAIPLTDSLATTWQRQIKLDYGKGRLIGSAAFVVGVTIIGSLIGYFGNDKMIWFLTALLVLYASVQMFSPSPLPRNEQSAVENDVTFRELLKDKNIFRLLLAASLIQGSHAMYYAYSVLYWTSEGISIQTTSLLWGLAVTAEIVLFFFSAKLFKHRSIRSMLYFTATSALVRWAVLSSSTNLIFIAVTQMMHALTFAANHYTVMRYISTQPPHYMVKLQGLYSAMASCMAVALLTALSGFLYPINPQFGFMAMMAFAVLAIFLVPRHVEQSVIKSMKE